MRSLELDSAVWSVMTDYKGSIPVPQPERPEPPKDPQHDPEPRPEEPRKDPESPGRKINLPPEVPIPSRPLPQPERPVIT